MREEHGIPTLSIDRPYKALSDNAAPEVYNIGDSFAAGRVREANGAAWRLAI